MAKKLIKKEENQKSQDATIKKSKVCCMVKNPWMISTIVLGIISIIAILFAIGFGTGLFNTQISQKQASNELTTIFSDMGQAITVLGISEESNLYKFDLESNGQTRNAFMTIDGKYLITSVMDIKTLKEQIEALKNANLNEEIKTQEPIKTDKPEVELFVMSYCPFGTQAEKGILEAVKSLGSSVDFKIKFVDYIMHGEKEVYENLTQYCIQKEEPNKFINYLECFLKDGDNNSCIVNTNVDVVKLEDCKTLIDKEYKITELLKDETTWLNGTFPQFNVDSEMNLKYGVQGSPTLIVNGVEMDSSRSADAYLKTICASFKEAPEVCNLSLSTETPTAGFGYTGTTSEGVC